jgi:hypothetical protein
VSASSSVGSDKSYGQGKVDHQLSLTFSTKDYNKFSFFDENREARANSKHVSDLVKCLLQHNFLKTQPIKVTKDFKIVDGQHRFLAAKKAGVEIYYVFDDRDPYKVMIEANTYVKAWGTKDFIRFSAKRGNKNHEIMINAVTLYGLPVVVLGIFALDDGQEIEMKFRKWLKSEEFVIGDEENFKLLCEVYTQFIAIVQRNTSKSLFYIKSERAAKAFKILCSHPDFDKERLLKNMDICPHLIEQQLNVGAYVQMFEKVYNYHQRNKLSLTEIHGE